MITKLYSRRTVALSTLIFLAIAPLAGIAAAAERSGAKSEVMVPSKVIVLFNGTDLTNFSTWLVGDKFNDPKQVFRVVDQIDGAPAIRISGESYGGLITKQSFRDYHLVAEFRWGSVTWGNRKNRTMDSGILLHCQGREGASAADFNGPWMHSIEYQLIEGGTGDFIRVRGHTESGQVMIPSLTSTVRLARNGQYNYDPNGETKVFDAQGGGRLNWYGRDPDWKDVLGFRGVEDVEEPVGKWNKIEIICKGDNITSMLNGRIVNKATASSLSEGRLLFQSEGAELFFRRIELHPVR